MHFLSIFNLSRLLYSAAIFLGIPLLHLHLKRRIGKGKEDSERISERQGITSLPRPEGTIVWFHAASVGESLSAIPVIDYLLGHTNNLSVLLTTGSVTSAKLMHERLPKGAFHQYIPLDNPVWIQRFLDYWKPSVVIWLESEFWPNTLYKINKHSIPLILLNGRISERSYEQWNKAPWIIRGMLSCFDLCLAQASEDARYLSELGAKNVINLGNIKLNAPALPVDENQLSLLSNTLKDRPRWLLSSTHDGEEIMASNIHQSLRQEHQELLTIIVPRHPERGPAIAALLRSYGLKVGLRSDNDIPEDDTDIYVADTMGELGLFYRLCEIVFMGKSLVSPGGGQNPFEAAKLNRAVLFGPNMSNFVELSAAMKKAGAAHQIENAQALQRDVSELLSSPEEKQNRMQAAMAFCHKSENIIADSVAEILRFLPENKCNKH